jgi:mono/diheme cytochrome c family protein
MRLAAPALALLMMPFATSAAPPAATDGTSLLPAGPYRELVVRTCANCHSIDLVVAKRRTREQWDQLIGVMVDRGAQATDEELDQILQYLAGHFGSADEAAK